MATYTVKPGDSWFRIAGNVYGDQRMAGALQAANSNISVIKTGQTLRLPDKQDDPYVSEATVSGDYDITDALGRDVTVRGVNPYSYLGAQLQRSQPTGASTGVAALAEQFGQAPFPTTDRALSESLAGGAPFPTTDRALSESFATAPAPTTDRALSERLGYVAPTRAEERERKYYVDQTQRLIDERYSMTIDTKQSPWLKGLEAETFNTPATLLDPIRAYAAMLFKNTTIRQPGRVGGGSTTEFLTAEYEQKTTYEQELRRIQETAVAGREIADPTGGGNTKKQLDALAARWTMASIAAWGGHFGEEYEGERSALVDVISPEVAAMLPIGQDGTWKGLQEQMYKLGYSWDPTAYQGDGAFIFDGMRSPVYSGVTNFGQPPSTSSGRRSTARSTPRSYGGYGSASENAWQWRIRIT